MSAIISSCQAYRYRLQRDVSSLGALTYAYFGINPSTADASIDDHTVRKWCGFTERNNGNRFIVGNVFAFRSKDVTKLATTGDPTGPDNAYYVSQIIQEADVLVPCWGSRTKLPKSLHSTLDAFLSELLASDKPVKCFGKTVSGDPKHPQMLSYSTELVNFKELT